MNNQDNKHKNPSLDEEEILIPNVEAGEPVLGSRFDQDEIQGNTKQYSYSQMVWIRFRKHKMAFMGACIILILLIGAVFASWMSGGQNPSFADINIRFLPPFTPGHFLGTDDVGRDVWTRLLYGGRTSLLIGFFVAIPSGFFGGIVGSISGYFGGWVDSFLMRLVEIFFSIPTLPILVTLSSYFGANKFIIIGLLILFGWAPTARMIRGLVLQIKQYEFVEAAKAIGCSDTRIIMRHIFPNTFAILIVQITLKVGGAILAESTLSFLGLGVNPAEPTWGNMLSNAQNFMWNAPHLVIWPGLMIFLIILSFNFLGDGLRDALDPKLKQ
ncbi:MAG: ABC transporter permease [Caldisericia bacterium]|nr:ABC transporter permease [Caldisericia bacterium]